MIGLLFHPLVFQPAPCGPSIIFMAYSSGGNPCGDYVGSTVVVGTSLYCSAEPIGTSYTNTPPSIVSSSSSYDTPSFSFSRLTVAVANVVGFVCIV